jgi:hypothetical protein
LNPLSEAISRQIAERVRAESKAETLRQQQALVAREKEVAEKERALDQKVEERVRTEQARIVTEAQKKAREDVALEIDDLKQQAAENDKKLIAFQEAELEFRRQKRAVEDKSKSLDLEVDRKLDAERDKIRTDIEKKCQDEHRLKDAEKDKKLADALRVNEEMRRKLEQGSQQTQGEVLELEGEELFRTTFPFDEVEPVPKGVNGADTVHRVMTKSGYGCGAIAWEFKRAKTWNEDWVSKLKDDQLLVKAHIAVLVSEALPKGVTGFGWYKGIWVCSPQFAVSLAFALRFQLIEVAMVKMAAVGKNEKMEMLFDYACTGFRQRVQAIVEAILDMQKDLAKERRVTQRRLARREKQIEKVMSSMSNMYGEFQGLIGSSLQTIPLLSSADEQDPSKSEEDLD